MTVYVDDMRRRARVGRISGTWSHMFADTHEELMLAAIQIGLNVSWVQHLGTYREHFDVTESVRERLVKAGARELSYPRGTAELLAKKRAAR